VTNPVSAARLAWFGYLWSTVTSVVVALTIQAVPALVIPVLASAVPLAAGPSITARRNLALIASLILLAFICLAILSVGWFYLPSFVAAITITTGAEREAGQR
jgi:hypothetical protein